MLSLAGRFLIALWHVVGLALLALLAVEFAVEGWRRANRWLRYRRAAGRDSAALADAHGGADWAHRYFNEFRRGVRIDWKPYVEWWQRPFRGDYLTLDARGLRPTPGEDTAEPLAVRILCFGGSTMMGMGARDAATIPAALSRRLGELGHAAAVTNYGQLGHNLTQETITLQQLLKSGERIDIAIFYDGANEMACAEQTGRADGMFNEARRRAEFNLLHPQRHGALVAAALISALPRTVRRLRRLTGAELRGPFPHPAVDLLQIDPAALARDVVALYVANLRLIRSLAAEYRFRPLFFWQPVITTKRVKSADEQRWEADYTHQPELRRTLYAAIVAARKADSGLGAATDAFDFSGLFDAVAEPIYIDLYHLSEAGNETVAEAMLPAVMAAVEAIVKRDGAGV